MNGWLVFGIFIAAWVASIFYLVRIKNVSGAVGSIGGGFVIAAMLLSAVSFAAIIYRSTQQTTGDSTPPLCDQSAWDGAVPSVVQHLTATLDDPDFQDADWGPVFRNPGGYHLVVKYRAKNAHGAWQLRYQEYWLDGACAITKVNDF